MENKKTRRIGTRLAVFGCALALVTMAGVGMTFAKYTKTDMTSEQTKVAGFGVSLSSTGNLFKTAYEAEKIGNPEDYPKDFANQSIEYSVSSESDTQTVIAPGTSGSKTFTATINDNEVAVNIGFDLDITLTSWTVDGAAYEPVTWTLKKELKNGTASQDVTKYYNSSTSKWDSDTAVNLTAEQVTAATTSENFKANMTNATAVYTLTWSWAFEDTTTAKAAQAISVSAINYAAGATVSDSDYANLTDYNKAKVQGNAGNYTVKTGEVINQDAISYAANDTITTAQFFNLPEQYRHTAYVNFSTDIKDTLLGTADSAATIKVVSTLTATQID